MSPVTDEYWGDDLLAPDETLPNGRSVTIQLPFPLNEANRYDIRLVDSDMDSYIKWDVLVSDGARIVFTFDDFVGQ